MFDRYKLICPYYVTLYPCLQSFVYMGIFGTLSEDSQFDLYAVDESVTLHRTTSPASPTGLPPREKCQAANVAIGEETGVATWGKCGETRGMGLSFDGLSHLIKVERGLNG